jgi:hypothetical protein
VGPRRREHDCGLWSLSCFLSRPYEEVFLEAAKVDKDAGANGLWMTQIVKIAKRLGVKLKLRRRFNHYTTTGILGMYLDNVGHVCILKQGQVIDVDQTVTDVDVYIKTRKAKITSILVMS